MGESGMDENVDVVWVHDDLLPRRPDGDASPDGGIPVSLGFPLL